MSIKSMIPKPVSIPFWKNLMLLRQSLIFNFLNQVVLYVVIQNVTINFIGCYSRDDTTRSSYPFGSSDQSGKLNQLRPKGQFFWKILVKDHTYQIARLDLGIAVSENKIFKGPSTFSSLTPNVQWTGSIWTCLKGPIPCCYW